MKKSALKRSGNYLSIAVRKAEYVVTDAGRGMRCGSGRCCRHHHCVVVKEQPVQD